MRLIHRLLIASGMTAAALSCSDNTAPVYPEPCDGVVQVSVSTDNAGTPVISWSPSCGMSRVAVSTVAPNRLDETPLWAFTVPENATVGPGVLYGSAPERATVSSAPQALSPGTVYRVILTQTVGGDVAVAGGEATFTR